MQGEPAMHEIDMEKLKASLVGWEEEIDHSCKWLGDGW